MLEIEAHVGDHVIIERPDVDALFESLHTLGYAIVGPTIHDRAIVYDELDSTADLPIGWTDVQDGGDYRLEPRGDNALFGYAVGPQSWKKYLFPPELELWNGHRTEGGFEPVAKEPLPRKLAFFGVRSCELHAIFIQDRVFMGGPYVDPAYRAQRENSFIVALDCGTAGGTCFCVSMGTGPKADAGFDLALTEVLAAGRHYFVVEVGSQLGIAALERVPHRPATEGELDAAQSVVENTAAHMGREMDTTGIKELLYGNYEHPQWDDVALRCLSCANCTMVCPTCFCSTVDEVTDLAGEEAGRVRRWDSCFSVDFSYIHGGSVRPSPRSRYRQWMTHKLGTWIDQFGTSGCVGCGRCITWCPVAIDITKEVAAIRATPKEHPNGKSHPRS